MAIIPWPPSMVLGVKPMKRNSFEAGGFANTAEAKTVDKAASPKSILSIVASLKRQAAIKRSAATGVQNALGQPLAEVAARRSNALQRGLGPHAGPALADIVQQLDIARSTADRPQIIPASRCTRSPAPWAWRFNIAESHGLDVVFTGEGATMQ